jgi:hypothetical protein
MNSQKLNAIARKLVSDDKGLLARDESTAHLPIPRLRSSRSGAPPRDPDPTGNSSGSFRPFA